MTTTAGDVSAIAERVVAEFSKAAQAALGADLVALVLFGSAAEGRLRASSDVNLIVVLTAFDPAKANALREPLRTANAAVELNAMFLLQAEIPAALEAFAMKFNDVLHRRKVVFGADPFAGLTVPRPAEIFRLKQVLLNLTLRTRAGYLQRSLREEQLAKMLADLAGPLRSAAATLRELEGKPALPPKESLHAFLEELGGAGWADVERQLSQARETGQAAPGTAGPAVLKLIDAAEAMRKKAAALA